MTASWQKTEDPPDYMVPDRELWKLWAANRNNLTGCMAADEMMRRLGERFRKEEDNETQGIG